MGAWTFWIGFCILAIGYIFFFFFFFSSRRRHTRCSRDWSSDVCSSDLRTAPRRAARREQGRDPEARRPRVLGAPAVAVLQDLGVRGCRRDPERAPRSEERRVGKECRSRWSPYH